MLYRLFTEDVDRDTTLDLVGKFTPGFTAYPTIGYWQGEREDSLCIEIESEEITRVEIDALAAAICIQNKQQCVLVQQIENHSWFVETPALDHVPDLALNEHAEERQGATCDDCGAPAYHQCTICLHWYCDVHYPNHVCTRETTTEERALDPVTDTAEIERGAELIRWLQEARSEQGQALAEVTLILCAVALALLAIFAAAQGAGNLDALASLIP